MDVAVSTLVKQQGELLLANEFGHGINCCKVAGGERGKGINIIFVFVVVLCSNNVSSHINDNDAVNPDFYELLSQNLIHFFKLFLTDNTVIHSFTSLACLSAHLFYL
ncbi:hypothetical protein BMS3Abin13_01010 [bacterium BMS3Abin13]|nr:hypothetical protein BMS3Abin13_01010 [bacterium BMS3Abin13]